MSVSQPTILVKKKDGTSARMTMEEFKVYKNGPKDIANGQSPTNDTNVKQPPAVSHKPEAVKPLMKQWTKEDHKSPLEGGEVKEARKQEVVKTVLPENRGDAYDAVIKNLKFPVADELRPRLKSLIVSRVKDIRTDEQVVEYATRAVANGGLGLTEAQAGELVRAVRGTGNGERGTAEKYGGHHLLDNKVKSPISNLHSATQTDTSHVPRPTFLEHRPIMHDVIAPVAPRGEIKASVGPIEELQEMTLTDFRRLSANPTQAGEILFKKFEGLKQESYLLFLKAVQSWYNSPLYRQYQQITADAINEGVKINQTLGQINNEEWTALVKLCNSL